MKKNQFQIASILCYCFSLVLPTFLSDGEIGLYFLTFGWIALANPIGPIYLLGLPWLANFIYFLNLALVKKANILTQITISIITILFSLFLFFVEDMAMEVSLGFWFWVLSFIVLMIGQLMILFKSRKKNLISDYQEKWAEDYLLIKNILVDTNSSVSIQIEHIGSTAIAGMKAKPIIDINLVYTSEQEFETIKMNLESLGYYHNGDQGIVGREVFKRNPDSNHNILDSITHHLFVCHVQNEELKKHLLFRDSLMQNKALAQEYEDLKLRLAEKANQDKKIYSMLKEKEASAFIQECIKKEIQNGKFRK
ncbi:GrpB family protein [Ekhidna sp.]|uniref:GrpB family protein n=1 Tax=Ekhidna sp. TaxID=2608089 RepID=UPI0032971D0B